MQRTLTTIGLLLITATANAQNDWTIDDQELETGSHAIADVYLLDEPWSNPPVRDSVQGTPNDYGYANHTALALAYLDADNVSRVDMSASAGLGKWGPGNPIYCWASYWREHRGATMLPLVDAYGATYGDASCHAFFTASKTGVARGELKFSLESIGPEPDYCDGMTIWGHALNCIAVATWEPDTYRWRIDRQWRKYNPETNENDVTTYPPAYRYGFRSLKNESYPIEVRVTAGHQYEVYSAINDQTWMPFSVIESWLRGSPTYMLDTWTVSSTIAGDIEPIPGM